MKKDLMEPLEKIRSQGSEYEIWHTPRLANRSPKSDNRFDWNCKSKMISQRRALDKGALHITESKQEKSRKLDSGETSNSASFRISKLSVSGCRLYRALSYYEGTCNSQGWLEVQITKFDRAG